MKKLVCKAMKVGIFTAIIFSIFFNTFESKVSAATTDLGTHLFNFTGWGNDYTEVTYENIAITGIPTSVSGMPYRNIEYVMEQPDGKIYCIVMYELEAGQTDDYVLKVYELNSSYAVISTVLSIVNDNNFNYYPKVNFLLGYDGYLKGIVRGYGSWDDKGFYIHDFDGVVKYGKSDAANIGYLYYAWEGTGGHVYGYVPYGPHDIASNITGNTETGMVRFNRDDTVVSNRYYPDSKSDMNFLGIMRKTGEIIMGSEKSGVYGKTYAYNINTGANTRVSLPNNDTKNLKGFSEHIVIVDSTNAGSDSYKLSIYNSDFSTLAFEKTFTNSRGVYTQVSNDGSYLEVMVYDMSSNRRKYLFNIDMEFVGFSTTNIYPQYGMYSTSGAAAYSVKKFDFVVNEAPTITATNTNKAAKTGVNFTITGNVTDADNNDVTVSATVGGVLKSTVVAGGNAAYTLTWSGTEVAQGTYTNIVVTADDGAITATATYTGTITVDKTEPNVSFGTNGNTTYANSHSSTVTVTDAESGITSLQYVWSTSTTTPGAGWAAFTSGQNLTLSTAGSGNYYLHIKATDNVGNVNDIRSNVFKIDNTNPVAPTLNMSEAWINSNRTFSVTGGSDSYSGVSKLQYKIDSGVWTDYSSSVTALSTTGEVTVFARTVDNAGNLSSEVTKVARVDKTNPGVPTLNMTETWINGNRTFTVTGGFDGNSGISKLQYKIGSGAWTDYSSTTTALTTSGTVIVYAKTIDVAGNESSQVSKLAKVDKTAPAAPVISVNISWSNTDETVTITHGVDSNSGVNRTEYRLTGATNLAWATYLGNITISNNGTTTIEARTTDNVGIVGSTSSKSVKIDKNNPVVTITPNGQASWGNVDVAYTVSTSDALSGIVTNQIRHSLDDGGTYGAWQDIASPTYNGTLTPDDGKRKIQVRVVDTAGNENILTSNVYNIDKTKPTAPTINANTNWSNLNQTITVTSGTDSLSGVNKSEYRLAGATMLGWTTYSSGFTVSNEGVTTIEVRTIDNVGNISDAVGSFVKIDKTAPTFTSASVLSADYQSGSDYWIAVGTDAKVKLRGMDATSGMKQTYINVPNSDSNVAYHNWDNVATHLVESNVSVNTDIIGANETYEALNEYEVEFIVRGLATKELDDINFNGIDVFGNTNGYVATGLRIGVDGENPGAPTITANTSWSKVNETVSISNGTETKSGINRTEYRLTGATTLGWTTYTVPFVISNEGTTSVEARTIDNVGNIGTVATKNINIDKTNPAGSFTPNSQAAWGNSDVAFTLNTSDDRSGLAAVQTRYSLDGGSTYVTGWANVAYPTYNGSLAPSEGRRVIQAKIIDEAGNETIITSGVYNIDKTNPTSPTVTANTSWSNSNETITVTSGVDGLSGVNRVEYRLTGDTTLGWTTYTVPVVISNEGTTMLEARTIDNAGNISSVVSDFVKVDKTLPTISVAETRHANSIDIVVTGADALAGMHATESYTYYIKVGNGSEQNLGSSTNNTYTYSSILNNATYILRQEVKDVAGNINENIINVQTDAVNPSMSIMSKDEGKLKVLVAPNALNISSPEIKIKGVNVLNGADVVESGWSRLNMIELPGFTLNETYKITAFVKSDNGVINPEITLANEAEFLGDTEPPFIEEFEINYGENTTTSRYVDLKLMATASKVAYEPLQVQFEIDGIKRGYVNGVWHAGVFGECIKYYPSFDVGDSYGNKVVYVTVKDKSGKVSKQIKEITYITVESETPKIEIVPEEDREEEVNNGEIKYLNNGYIMTKERLVRLKLKASEAKEA